MESPDGDRSSGIDVLPLHVGEETYAVKLDRVATVLRPSVLDDADPGTVIELSEHTVEIAAAASLLGERCAEENAIVVFHGRGSNGHVPGCSSRRSAIRRPSRRSSRRSDRSGTSAGKWSSTRRTSC